MLTTQEVAEWFGVNPMTIYRKAKKGELPAIKFGKQWLFPEDALNEWIKENTSSKGRTQKSDKTKRVTDFGKIKSIQLVYLFGSAASGQVTPLSDIDIAYLDDGSADPFNFEIELESCVRKMFPDAGRIDLVRLVGAPIQAKFNVVHDGKLLYARSDEIRSEFEAETILEYLDFEPTLESFYEYERATKRKDLQEILPIVSKLIQHDKRIAVILLGSRAKKEASKSDWDIGITRIGKLIGGREYLKLRGMVSDEAEDMLHNVDLINIDKAPAWFIKSIDYKPIFLGGSKEAFIRFQGVINGTKRDGAA